MTCYHPVAIERLKPTHPNYDPKHKIRFLGPAKDLLDIDVHSTMVSTVSLIPCGYCIGCRIDKARDWAVRICCEMKTHEWPSWFLTLTYDDDHMDSLSLNKEHIRKFIKDLRNYVYYKYGLSIRYFLCGEYGDNSGRRHYHAIIFNLPTGDITPRSSSNGFLYYESKTISDIWSKGYVVIAELNLNTASYVARYTLKKQGLKKYDDLGIQAPFILMSTRPGLGYDYLIGHKDSLIERPYILIDHKYYPLPRYFKRILEEQYYIPTEFFNDDVIEKNYKLNLIKEIKSGDKLENLLEQEELDLEASQKNRRIL